MKDFFVYAYECFSSFDELNECHSIAQEGFSNFKKGAQKAWLNFVYFIKGMILKIRQGCRSLGTKLKSKKKGHYIPNAIQKDFEDAISEINELSANIENGSTDDIDEFLVNTKSFLTTKYNFSPKNDPYSSVGNKLNELINNANKKLSTAESELQSLEKDIKMKSLSGSDGDEELEDRKAILKARVILASYEMKVVSKAISFNRHEPKNSVEKITDDDGNEIEFDIYPIGI